MNGGGWLGVTDGHGVTVSSEQTNPPMTGEGEGGGGWCGGCGGFQEQRGNTSAHHEGLN